MALYPSLFSFVEVPDDYDERRPQGRPDGTRTVRRPSGRRAPRT